MYVGRVSCSSQETLVSLNQCLDPKSFHCTLKTHYKAGEDYESFAKDLDV